ncbi:hypothetical protein [Nesterenkonia lutea]|uniref:SipW-cognate class signal peptide n=1 Tax=Nesterenkonia lutea TaxID=272919 RepID=A0ABR9JG37_9MICC|nr:hypothetical protein [Nesterenkonia lutea]MBE1524894.1 hypothetical protein [Nesterenkonia lutea]
MITPASEPPRRGLPENPRNVRRDKVRALLASGSVLGLGAVMTVASWNAPQSAGATLTAGEFILTSSTDGQEFTQYSPESPASLDMGLPDVGRIAPGNTVYALFSVSTAAESVGGTVVPVADADNGTGLGEHLTYGVRRLPTEAPSSPACNADTFAASSAEIVPLGSPLATGASPESSQLLAAHGANQVDFCFSVLLPEENADSARGTSVNASWEMAGTTEGAEGRG